jgi:hypothetical protein
VTDLANCAPTSRPLGTATRAELLARFDAALRARDGAAGAHCVHELWWRGEISLGVEAMLERLWLAAGASVPEWLPQAYEIAARFAPVRRGRTHVYLVLLDYEDRRGPERYGVYVGQSGYAPAERFDQHKAGIRASGSVLKRGLEVLAGPTLHLQGISRADAERIERDLAAALDAAGLLVSGGH